MAAIVMPQHCDDANSLTPSALVGSSGQDGNGARNGPETLVQQHFASFADLPGMFQVDIL
ncbi:unnamed protein product, partial [Heterosigma akashiwo]